jgi:hypothetical protein
MPIPPLRYTIGRLRIVIGTTNPAKERQCRLALRATDLRLLPLADVVTEAPEVVEDGWSAEENAARKAGAYTRATGLPVLSLDYALAFAGIPPDRQPGLHVRRIPGVDAHASDDELLEYYSSLFARYGGRVEGRWEAGAAVATPAGRLERTAIPVHRTFVAEQARSASRGIRLPRFSSPRARHMSPS